MGYRECPGCGFFYVSDDEDTCPECGELVPRTCPYCGTEYDRNDFTCPGCGRRIDPLTHTIQPYEVNDEDDENADFDRGFDAGFDRGFDHGYDYGYGAGFIQGFAAGQQNDQAALQRMKKKQKLRETPPKRGQTAPGAAGPTANAAQTGTGTEDDADAGSTIVQAAAGTVEGDSAAAIPAAKPQGVSWGSKIGGTVLVLIVLFTLIGILGLTPVLIIFGLLLAYVLLRGYR